MYVDWEKIKITSMEKLMDIVKMCLSIKDITIRRMKSVNIAMNKNNNFMINTIKMLAKFYNNEIPLNIINSISEVNFDDKNVSK